MLPKLLLLAFLGSLVMGAPVRRDTPAVEDNTEEPPLVHVKPIFAPTDDIPVVYTEEA